MAGAITRAKDREQNRFETEAAPRNYAEELSHISMGSYSRSAPLSIQTPTGTAFWMGAPFIRGSGSMHQEKQPFVFKENQTLSSTYTALSQVMDGMAPEDRRISLEAMMSFFSSNDPIEEVELPTATSGQREAATLMTAILAAENHMTRTAVGGKLERAVICMLQSGVTFSRALNSTNGDFVQSQDGGNKVVREALSNPSATPARFHRMGQILNFMSDSSDEEDEEMESPPQPTFSFERPAPPQPFSFSIPAPQPFSSIATPPSPSTFSLEMPVRPSPPPQEQISPRGRTNDSRQHIEQTPGSSSIPIEEQLVVQYILLLHSSSNLFDNEPEGMADFLHRNVYLMRDHPNDITSEAMNVLANFIQRHWHV